MEIVWFSASQLLRIIRPVHTALEIDLRQSEPSVKGHAAESNLRSII